MCGATTAKELKSDPPWGFFTPGCQQPLRALEQAGFPRSPHPVLFAQPEGTLRFEVWDTEPGSRSQQDLCGEREEPGGARSTRPGTGCASDP